jgi:hypothetical protein
MTCAADGFCRMHVIFFLTHLMFNVVSTDARKMQMPFSGNNSLRGQRSAASSQADAVPQRAPPKITTTQGSIPPLPEISPVISTAHSTEEATRHLQIVIGDERPPHTTVSSSQLAKMAQEAAAMDSSVPDPQMASLPSSNMESNPMQHLPSYDTGRTSTRSQPPPSEHKEHHHHADKEDDADDGTVVSSLTGVGLDQEIVEELHMALTELKQELEESRAEAARAVKVAEQAIQSAENSSSKDWNSTVTHKAAEAAALAQKKSAEAMAKQRLAEERLEGEKRNASFWRKQAEAAEEEAGALQTRAAAAEVQRAAMMEALANERRKGSALVGSMKQRFSTTESHQKENLEATMERNRELEVELEATRRTLAEKELQASFEDDGKELGSVASAKKKLYGRIKDDGAARTLLAAGSRDSTSSDNFEIRQSFSYDSPKNSLASAAAVLRVHSEFTTVRKYRFERNEWTDLGFSHDLLSHTNCFLFYFQANNLKCSRKPLLMSSRLCHDRLRFGQNKHPMPLQLLRTRRRDCVPNSRWKVRPDENSSMKFRIFAALFEFTAGYDLSAAASRRFPSRLVNSSCFIVNGLHSRMPFQTASLLALSLMEYLTRTWGKAIFTTNWKKSALGRSMVSTFVSWLMDKLVAERLTQ